ncbi:MAG: ATP-dependent DNA helicase [Armatimonadetes bacterium]|nr:ATP-dependent DNA helicase [Armatimonadota bacterium]
MPAIDQTLTRIVSQLPEYEVRPQQQAMARLVARCLQERRHAIIEAGTGSGKSFAYLIPILEGGKTAVVATGTIALQEQLLHKDLPFIEKALGRPIKVALAKGRSHYLCLRKLQETDQAVLSGDPRREPLDHLIQLRAEQEWDGDRANLPFVVEGALWSELLASDSDDCLGSRCPHFAISPQHVARVRCEQAQIIIANHALYFTDLATGAGVLPRHDVVVFDEAHHLDRAAVHAFAITVGRHSASRVMQRVQRRFRSLPLHLIQRVNEAESLALEAVFRHGRGQFPLTRDPDFTGAARAMARALAQLAAWIGRADTGQMLLLDSDPGEARMRAEVMREQMASVAQGLACRWEHFASVAPEAERANWMQIDPSRDYFELYSAPLSAAAELRRLLWSQRTCVLTSATLAVDGSFDFLKRELGLEETEEAILGSPFDYPRQALLYVPSHVPAPNDPQFTSAIIPLIEDILLRTRGRAFVLFTSYRALREVAGALIGRLPFPCHTQEELPRQRLIEWFRSTPHSVLFATATFWEGVDVPGEALSCVIIDKLPFASPDDPVVQARTERMRAAHEDWFNGFMLPRATLALKQGFGRLVRSRLDRGLIAILDKRLLTMRYGQAILRSLPPARRVTRLPETLEAAFLSGDAPHPGLRPPLSIPMQSGWRGTGGEEQTSEEP